MMVWLLTKGRYPYMVMLLALTVWLSFFASRVNIEQGNESMNAKNEEQLRSYYEFKRLFGSDEDILLSVTNQRLLEPEGLRLIDDLTERIGNITGVRRVQSLTNAGRLVSGPFGVEKVSLVARPLTAPGIKSRIQSALDGDPQFNGLLISKDRHTTGITIEIEDRSGDDLYRKNIIHALRQLIEDNSNKAEFHLSGISVQKQDVTEFIQRDQAVLIPLSVLTIALLLLLMFRSVPGVLLPLAVTGVSLSWTLGIYSLAGFSLNTITALIPPVIMVLSITTSVHIYHHWLKISGSSRDPTRLIVESTRMLFSPCFFTALTTALGLISLTVSNTPAVRLFGVFGAVGVLVSFFVGITLVPIGLSFLPPRDKRDSAHGMGMFERLLQGMAKLSIVRPRMILLVAVLLALVGIIGISRIRNNTDLVRFFKTSAPLYRDTMFIDRNLAGVNSLEFMLSRKDGKPLTSLEDLKRIEAFKEMTLQQEYVSGTYSVADMVEQIQRAETGRKGPLPPYSQEELNNYFGLMNLAGDKGLLRRFIKEDFTKARISSHVHAIGTSIARPLIGAILNEGKKIFGEAYSLVPTGGFYQVVQDSTKLVLSQVKSFSLSLAMVILAIFVLFRSFKLTLVALIPNLIPIVWTGGLMGYFGIGLSAGTAMIASVVIGLAVDDTIHYLVCYRREYCVDSVQAVKLTTTGIGRALSVTSFVLVLGFWVGSFGSFKPTIYFSLLTGITMLGAWVCDLLVLPACLILIDPTRKNATILTDSKA